MRSRRRIHIHLALPTWAVIASALLGVAHAQQGKPDTPVLAPGVLEQLEEVKGLEITAASKVGRPTFVRGEIDRLQSGRRISSASLATALQKVAPAMGVSASDLIERSNQRDSLGYTHVQFDQRKNGLPVIGTRLTLHIDKEGVVYAASGNVQDDDRPPRAALILPTVATQRAKEAISRANEAAAERSRLVYVVSTLDQTMYLAHEVVVKGTQQDGTPIDAAVYVDAVTGRVVDVHTRVHQALHREVYNANLQNTVGPVARAEGAGPIGNNVVDTNYDHLGITYQYYSLVFGRDSYNSAGAPLISVVNFREFANQPFINAFWNGQLLVYGDGDGFNFDNFALALDVTAHELTHAVTERSSGLIYANEPGALNEGMSDVFGAMCEAWWDGSVSADTWKLLEDIKTPGTPNDAERYMDNPTADGHSKDFYPARYQLGVADIPSGGPSGNDYGFVHHNSGIVNLAFKLLVTGGMHPRAGQAETGGPIPTTTVPAIGQSQAEQVFYRANTVYLGPGAHFIDARQATVLAASDLYGSVTAQAVSIAWDVVGVPAYSNRRPINISTRARVGTGGNNMIAGFVLGGSGSSKPILMRAVGPTLATFGVSGALSNPELTLYSGSTSIGYNDDWSSSPDANAIASTSGAVGAFALPNPSNDAAMLPTLGNGMYSMHVAGVGGQAGVAIVEVYDTDAQNSSHLVNISTLAHVGTGSDIVIGGFVVSGAGNKYLLIRGVGPKLGSFGVSGAITNPKIDLYAGSTKIRENDDWEDNELGQKQDWQISLVTSRVGAFQLDNDSHDAALLVSVPAGSYSVHLYGVGGVTGVGMIEIYEVN